MAVRKLPPSAPRRDPGRAAPPRRPLRDNPRLILAGMLLLLAALAGIVALANRSARLSPDFVTDDAARIARALSALSIDGSDVSAVRDLILPDVAQGRVKMVEVYRVISAGGAVTVVPYVDVAAPAPDLPQGYARAVADRMAQH